MERESELKKTSEASPRRLEAEAFRRKEYELDKEEQKSGLDDLMGTIQAIIRDDFETMNQEVSHEKPPEWYRFMSDDDLKTALYGRYLLGGPFARREKWEEYKAAAMGFAEQELQARREKGIAEKIRCEYSAIHGYCNITSDHHDYDFLLKQAERVLNNERDCLTLKKEEFKKFLESNPMAEEDYEERVKEVEETKKELEEMILKTTKPKTKAVLEDALEDMESNFHYYYQRKSEYFRRKNNIRIIEERTKDLEEAKETFEILKEKIQKKFADLELPIYLRELDRKHLPIRLEVHRIKIK